MINEISSINNKKIKELRQLKLKKYRMEHCKYFIEGIRFIESAFEKQADILDIFYTDQLLSNPRGIELKDNLVDRGYNIFHVSENVFLEITDTVHSQGIIATIKILTEKEKKIDLDGKIFLALDRIQDPGNLGTIIRTADCAGVDGIFLITGTVDVYNPKVLRSTMGSIFDVNIYNTSREKFLEIIRENNIKLISTYLNTQKYYFDLNIDSKIVVVIGNEGNGICSEIIEKSDELIKIPIYGKAESLNASTACAVVIYDYANKIKNSI